MISVVVVNYNGKKFLDNCLSSLIMQTYQDFEIIVVDNGSSDDSSSYIRERYPSVILVETGKNLGFAGGTNAGIHIAKGEFILTLNNDTIADTDLLEEIIQPMQSDALVGMCGSKMLFPDGRINSTAICISRSGAAWDRGMSESDHGQYDVAEEIFGPCAGAALYRRSMLNEIGLFDEDFFLFMEDVDLAFRARLSGWKCMYVPTARVVHIHGGTAGFRSDLSIYYGNRNLMWYVVKNFPSRTLLLSSPWIITRNFADVPYYFIQGKGHAILLAKIHMMKGLPTMVCKRRDVKRHVPIGEIEKWIMIWNRVHKS
ncbi:MAG: glycosyltransferase family 2 protein [Methanoregula sp.]|nr:glycosyltransferase family 2 protein [Methanoregula sp.]